jgi:replicative DNA helicase
MEDNLYDEACEKTVLGTLLSDKNAIYDIREILKPECFYKAFHKDVYKAVLRLVDAGNEVNIITIIPELQKSGKSFKAADIAALGYYNVFEIKEYALHLSELEKRRQLFNLGLFLQQKSNNTSEDIADTISYTTDKINGILGDSVSHIKKASDYLKEVYQRVNDNINGIKAKCSFTGFHEIDNRGGFQPTNLIILAAESSQGKTAFADTVILNTTLNYSSSVAFYSLEMTGRQIMTRLAAMDSNIPCMKLSNDKLTPDELKMFDASLGRLNDLDIYFDDRSTSNIETIISSIRSMVIKHHIDGAIIDYLQIFPVNARANNIEAQLAEAARKLKNLAKELNIWILLLSQLNRSADSPEPTLSRLRGSGQINECADTTILLYRPEYYTQNYGKNYKYSGKYSGVETKGTAQINVAKGRNTGPYQFICGFTSSTTRFYDLSETPQMQQLPFDKAISDDSF